jgi:uncharacterized protein (UPF0333 family)
MKLRVVFSSVFCLAAVLIALGGAGLYLGSSKAQAQPGAESAAVTANSANGPDIVRLVRMVPGSAWNWIAVNAVQQSNARKKSTPLDL